MKQKKKKIKPKNIFVNDEAEDSGDEEIEDSEDEEDFGDSNETNMSSRKVTSQQSDKEDILETDATTHQQASSQNFLTNQNFSRNPTEKMNKKVFLRHFKKNFLHLVHLQKCIEATYK